MRGRKSSYFGSKYMPRDIASEDSLRHRHVEADDVSVHVIEGGIEEKPAVLFLHGWPENWSAFREVMVGLSNDAHVSGSHPMPRT